MSPASTRKSPYLKRTRIFRFSAVVFAGVVAFSAGFVKAQQSGGKPSSKLRQKRETFAVPTVLPVNIPQPIYPAQALKEGLSGSGVGALVINPSTGSVVRVSMTVSTGHALLDEAALATFRSFRYKPGGPAMVRMPITYTRAGGYYGGPPVR